MVLPFNLLTKKLANEHNWEVFIPPFEYTTDNAAMIGIVGYLKYIHNFAPKNNHLATARLKVEEG